MSEYKESELVLRLIDDDEGAFCDIYALYKDRLIYFTLKFIKSKESAEDICQDIFFTLWQNRHFINPNVPFNSYLYAIARNKTLYHLRSVRSRENLQNQILSQAMDFHDETTETISANELKRIISEAIQSLTDRQREIFEMSRNRGMSHKEIAESLKISIHTVQEHISVSLKVIQNNIKKYYGNYSTVLLLLVCLNS